MRSVHLFSAVAIVLSFGAVGLGARTASAAPCCSAPICQQEEPPSACNYCHIGCFDDEEAPEVSEFSEEEGEAVCYATESPEPAPGEDGERDRTVASR